MSCHVTLCCDRVLEQSVNLGAKESLMMCTC